MTLFSSDIKNKGCEYENPEKEDIRNNDCETDSVVKEKIRNEDNHVILAEGDIRGEDRRNKDRRNKDRRNKDRRNKDRRNKDRRNILSRRISNAKQRLRVGLWKAYRNKYEIGLDGRMQSWNKLRLHDELFDEAKKYHYVNKYNGEHVLPYNALKEAIAVVIDIYGDQERKAVFVVEEIANTISSKFEVLPKDKREKNRRNEINLRKEKRRVSNRREEERRGKTKEMLSFISVFLRRLFNK